MGRLIIAGIVGGIAMFIWSALAHTVLPLGHTGINEIPQDAAVLAGLQERLGDKAGLYMFPGSGLDEKAHESEAAMNIVMARTAKEPSGTLIYHPPGRDTGMGTYMGIELALEILQALIVAWVLTKLVTTSLAGRVAAATAIGVAVGVGTNGSYWNWFGYPTDYTLAAIVMQVVGYAVAGLAIALILGWKRKAAA